MVIVSKGLTFKTTTLHLGVIPEVILNLFCVVFLGIKTRTRICLLLPSFGQKKDVCLVQWCTHTRLKHTAAGPSSNTEILIIAYFILCAWSFDDSFFPQKHYSVI